MINIKIIEGRSAKSVRNVTTGVANKLLMMILAFATRTLFIRMLGAEYTGISSLYTNILSVLSLAEMGMGNVLMFYLYNALKENDEKRIAELVNEFKRIYTAIIILVLSVGLLIIPFLKYIVKSPLDSTELIGYYVLYLINSIASYFVVYRTTVLSADQKNYILNIVQTISTVMMYVIQIVYLLLFRNFWGYLSIQVLCTIGSNIVLNAISIKHYPFLKNRSSLFQNNERLVNRKELSRNIKATFLFKISDVILDQTDSIIISILFGTVFVGFYSNYYILISYIVAIAGIIANGLVASFGNLNTEGNMQRSYEMFRVALTAFSIYGTICTTCYACIVQDFVPIWVGPQYLMPYGLVLAVLAVFYLRMATNTMWMYRSAMGIFQEVQYINLTAAGLNIVLSVFLGKMIGVAGVIFATALSRLLTTFWYEGLVVFAKFRKSFWTYIFLQTRNFLICIFTVVVAWVVCSRLPVQGVIAIVSKMLVALLISSIIVICTYSWTTEFKTMKRKIIDVIKR